MNHKIMVAYQLVNQTRVANVTAYECEAILGQPRKGGPVARVGQLVQDCDRGVSVVERVADEVGSDESCPASHQKFRHAAHPMDALGRSQRPSKGRDSATLTPCEASFWRAAL